MLENKVGFWIISALLAFWNAIPLHIKSYFRQFFLILQYLILISSHQPLLPASQITTDHKQASFYPPSQYFEALRTVFSSGRGHFHLSQIIPVSITSSGNQQMKILAAQRLPLQSQISSIFSHCLQRYRWSLAMTKFDIILHRYWASLQWLHMHNQLMHADAISALVVHLGRTYSIQWLCEKFLAKRKNFQRRYSNDCQEKPI